MVYLSASERESIKINLMKVFVLACLLLVALGYYAGGYPHAYGGAHVGGVVGGIHGGPGL